MAPDVSNVLVVNGNTDSESGDGLHDGWLADIVASTGIPGPSRSAARGADWHTLRFDGASRGNPGPCGGGFVLYSGRLQSTDTTTGTVHAGSRLLGRGTNNWAEYQALIIGLEKASQKAKLGSQAAQPI